MFYIMTFLGVSEVNARSRDKDVIRMSSSFETDTAKQKDTVSQSILFHESSNHLLFCTSRTFKNRSTKMKFNSYFWVIITRQK